MTEETAPRIELSTSDLKHNNNNNKSVVASCDQVLPGGDQEGSNANTHRLSAPTTTSSRSSPATLSRLFQKRSHKSTTDVVEDKRCDSNRYVRVLSNFKSKLIPRGALG